MSGTGTPDPDSARPRKKVARDKAADMPPAEPNKDADPLREQKNADPLREQKKDSPAYQVLARKYRPQTFADLIGQEAMVRTLTNAIRTGRLAHAFVLTGVRGVGKTTTARIIARALNCIGPDGTGGPTPEPCGVCPNCRAIGEDRHVDVLEMDAASRTGVDDIREIIDGVRYRPAGARFKIYIVDEVHMLSKNAFNALLKTLEEPPEHVKFVFATTEIRKVPVTVLSRCQRFDLRRIDVATLIAHFKGIAEKEGARVGAGALHLIARAADGSVRDGLSLLDQAISRIGQHGVEVGETEVRAMLGLADRSLTFDLLEAGLKGDAATALALLAEQHVSGAEPAQVLEDALELVHWLTRVKVAPSAAEDPAVPEMERVRGRAMAGKLSMAVLTRAWQLLLKGLSEVRVAPAPAQAAEMVLVRLAYASELPTPEDALKSLAAGAAPSSGAPARTPPAASGSTGPASTMSGSRGGPATAMRRDPAPDGPPETHALGQAAPQARAPVSAPADPQDFAAVVALAEAHKEARLASHLRREVHLVRFEPGRIEFQPSAAAPSSLANDLQGFLSRVTGRRWVAAIANEQGGPTLAEEEAMRRAADKAQAAEHPLVRAVMEAFPNARIEEVRRAPPPESASADSAPISDETPEED